MVGLHFFTVKTEVTTFQRLFFDSLRSSDATSSYVIDSLTSLTNLWSGDTYWLSSSTVLSESKKKQSESLGHGSFYSCRYSLFSVWHWLLHSDCFQTKPVWAAVSGHDAPPPHICGARWSYLTCCPIKGTEMYPVTVDVCEQGFTHLYVDVM